MAITGKKNVNELLHMKTEQPFQWRRLSFTVFKQTSGDKCTKCEAATGCTDGGPASELVGDREQLLLSPKTEADFRGK